MSALRRGLPSPLRGSLGFRQGLLCWNATANALNDCGGGQARAFRPVGNAESFAEVGKPMVATEIAKLLHASCPAAIAWFVISVVVFAVNAVLGRRTIPHVGIEVGKRVPPSPANANAATAVPPKGFVGLTVAAINHVCPRPVFGRISESMRSMQAARDLGRPVAAAACCVPRAKVMRRNGCFLSAFAQAKPESFATAA